MSDILIAGLPGCGKSRWIAAQPDAERFQEWQWGDPIPPHLPVWTLIDLRGDPEAVFPVLKPLLPISDAFLGIFSAETDLSRQAAWGKKLRLQNFGGTPLHFSHFLARPEGLTTVSNRSEPINLSLPPLQKLTVQLPTMVLAHLLFVLDGLAQSTPMRFWRVQGTLMTLEYANPVTLEGALSGMWTYAGDQADGRLHMLVENLDLPALAEGLRASRVAGCDMDIKLNPE
ncbi:MAG TPA: hypothetical protein EYH46_03650 [Sulfurivirga caldicuralii]|nr:hypothetical protein [Sulfurivirga caldicuralii]